MVYLLHDNARPHIARLRVELFEGFGGNVLTHPPHSPDSAPSDYHHFTELLVVLRGQHHENDDKVGRVELGRGREAKVVRGGYTQAGVSVRKLYLMRRRLRRKIAEFIRKISVIFFGK